jgi:hypothetical protein
MGRYIGDPRNIRHSEAQLLDDTPGLELGA